jgi:hypothetical protein
MAVDDGTQAPPGNLAPADEQTRSRRTDRQGHALALSDAFAGVLSTAGPRR